MDNIYYDGNLKASLTVGSVSDINPLNAYTKDQVNELLREKSDVNHTHEQYLTEHQDISHLATKEEIPSIKGLATEEYVNNQIDNIDIPEVDLSNCATKEELNEVKQSVSEGKKLLASAITDMGIVTLATDTWETMVENILNINPYYIEYTVTPFKQNDILDNYKYIPNIKNIGDADFHRNYDGVRITLKDGSITKDLNTLVTDVEKIRIYYNARTEQLKFIGSLYNTVYIKTVDYLKTDNFTTFANMFQGCRQLQRINNMDKWITDNVTDMVSMFYECSSLTSLDLSNFNTSNVTSMFAMFSGCSSLTSFDVSSFNTSNVTNAKYMFSSVPVTVDWHYDGTNYANWTLTEEQTGFSGTFPWNQ